MIFSMRIGLKKQHLEVGIIHKGIDVNIALYLKHVLIKYGYLPVAIHVNIVANIPQQNNGIKMY